MLTVNCSWGTWSEWETCSITCGGGTQHRNRSISQQALNGGNGCAGNTEETRMGYTRVTSESFCKRVMTKTECEEAARQLGLSDTSAREETVSSYPPYCYFYKGQSLWFNNNANSSTQCNSDTKVCICQENLMEYTRVTSGSTCERVTTKTECEEAARQLGLSDTTAREETASSYPPYCYFYKGKSLWFNNDSNADPQCNSDSKVCICQETAQSPQISAPTRRRGK